MYGLIWKMMDALEILTDSDVFLGIFLITWLGLTAACVQELTRRK